MKILLLLFAFVFLIFAVVSGQSPRDSKDTAKALRSLYVRFLDSSRLKDRLALDEIMTDDYTQVTDDSRIRTKAIRLTETMRDGGTMEALELRDFSVRLYGDAAVAVCKVWEQYKYPDGTVKKYDIYSTATFVKQNRKWRIAATHISMTEVK